MRVDLSTNVNGEDSEMMSHVWGTEDVTRVRSREGCNFSTDFCSMPNAGTKS
jgi:hypothetical protein